jgi:hypothetical protein
MVSLRPYPEPELEAVWDESGERYVADLHNNGGLSQEEARSRGMRQIALNVFGGNAVARSLYASSGYAERSVHMSKLL